MCTADRQYADHFDQLRSTLTSEQFATLLALDDAVGDRLVDAERWPPETLLLLVMRVENLEAKLSPPVPQLHSV